MISFSQENSSKKAVFAVLMGFIILMTGLWLRVGSLQTRTVHADEAVQGMITSELLESGSYSYNPRKFHGPSLYYLSLPVAWIRGETNRQELDILSLRLVPFVFSLGICFVPFLFYRELSASGVLVSSGFLLMSPGLVYYGSFYIQESLMVAGFALFCGCYWRYRNNPRIGWAVGMGLAGGLMATSKESFPLYLVAVFAAGWAARLRLPSKLDYPAWKAAWIALMAAFLLVIPLFSSFGSNLHGLVDAVAGLFQYEPELGHDKPWYYYLSLLSGHERGQLFLRGEGALLACAISGSLVLLIKKASRPLGGYLTVLGLFLLICFSLFPYKTPWLITGTLVPMSLLAGYAFQVLVSGRQAYPVKILLIVLVIASWSLSVRETCWTTRQFPVEKRNPYAYVHTSWDLPELTDRILELADRLDEPVIKVISDEYWPIPWYLRSLDRVGYWSAMPDDPYAPVMVVSAELAGSLNPEKMKPYRYEFRGLRPGKLLLLYYLDD